MSNWRKALEQNNRKYCIEQRRSTKDVLAGMIKLIWQEQLSLWDKHTSKTALSTELPPLIAFNKVAMYKSKIRQLHCLRDSCLPNHRDQYFHDDIEGFLTTASCAQMKQYLHQYELAIQESVKTAKQQPIRSILTFPGFTRLRPRKNNNVLRHTLHPPPNAPQVQPPTVYGGNTLNRKHTRWKQVTNPLRSISTFFHHPAPPD